MDKERMLQPNDLLAIVVIIVGSIGFLLWEIGLSSIGSPTCGGLEALLSPLLA